MARLGRSYARPPKFLRPIPASLFVDTAALGGAFTLTGSPTFITPPAPTPSLSPYAPGNPFIYRAWTLTEAQPLDALPYYGVSFGEQINQPGPWSGSLQLRDDRLSGLNYTAATAEAQTLLGVEYLGSLVWCGILWSSKYRDSSGILNVQATEVGSYFQQRLQTFDYTTTWQAGADPMAIADQLYTDACAVTNGNLGTGITVKINPPTGSGVTITATYPATQLQAIDSMVSTLAQMGYGAGFDYSFDCQYAPGTRTPQIVLNLWFPRKGRTAVNSGLVIEHKHLYDCEYDKDGTQAANDIFAVGSSSGMLPARATANLPGFPLLQAMQSHTQINDDQTLVETAAGALAMLCYPVATPVLYLPIPVPDASGNIDTSVLTLGQFALGDSFMWRVDPVAGGGENTCPRFPNGMNFEWRINGWTATPADKGMSTLTLDAGIPPLNTVPPPEPP